MSRGRKKFENHWYSATDRLEVSACQRKKCCEFWQNCVWWRSKTS